MVSQLFLICLVSCLISFATGLITIKIFKSKNWLENPIEKQKKTGNATAQSPVPRGGGLAIFLPVSLVLLLFFPNNPITPPLLVAIILNLFIGLLDDIYDISPYFRIVSNLVSAFIVVFFAGLQITYISHPAGGVLDLTNLGFMVDLLAIFWIVWCINTVGWSAGIEGQLPGFVAIAAFFLMILGLRFSQDQSQWPVLFLSASLSGASLGFLPLNFHPQKIMPGYSGKSLSGFLLAIISILSGAKVAALILILCLPTLDAIWAIARRIAQGKSIFLGDANHFHHHLLRLGYSRRQIAVIYWLVSLLAGLLAISLNSQQKFFVFLALIFIFIGCLLTIYRKIRA